MLEAVRYVFGMLHRQSSTCGEHCLIALCLLVICCIYVCIYIYIYIIRRCRFRVLDSFGTEPEFNLASYKRPGEHGEWGTVWGNWNFNPRQFWTMFRKTNGDV